MLIISDYPSFALQVCKEGGHKAILEPPGSYAAYSCMYITACLIHIFTLATNTFEEQHRHVAELQLLSASAALRLPAMHVNGRLGTLSNSQHQSQQQGSRLGSHNRRPKTRTSLFVLQPRRIVWCFELYCCVLCCHVLLRLSLISTLWI